MWDYAKLLTWGTDREIKHFAEGILDRDFCKVASVRAEVEELFTHEQASQLHIIRMKFQSLPVKIRTARLHTWITANLRTLPMADEVHEEERLVYRHLCGGFAKSLTDGTMRREDLQLASKIAAGQLSASKAIRYLLDSFFAMQSKIDRGLVRTKRTADEETASELLFMLGHGAGVGDLLQNFGVLMPPQTTLHFESELVPKPFLAFRRQAQLRENVRLVASLLRCRGTRSAFVAIDES